MITNMTVVATGADTATVKTVDVRKWVSTANSTTACTINHTDAGGGAKTIVLTCAGATTAEQQENINKVQNHMSKLMVQSHLGSILSKVYVMNHDTIVADANLIHSTAGTSPLTTTAINL